MLSKTVLYNILLSSVKLYRLFITDTIFYILTYHENCQKFVS